MDILLIVWCVFAAAMVWLMVCDYRTVKQRSGLIDFVYRDMGTWRERSMFFNLVSYDRHLIRLALFRNPKYLYHFSLWDGLR